MPESRCSCLPNARFDRSWRPLPSSAAVFDANATRATTWLCERGKPHKWKWPFFYVANDDELATLLLELARITHADSVRCESSQCLKAAIAAATSAPPPAAPRKPPDSVEEYEARRAELGKLEDDDNEYLDPAFRWLDGVVEAATTSATAPQRLPSQGSAAEVEMLRDSIICGGVIVLLGGGHNGLAELLSERHLLKGPTPVGAVIYFDDNPAAISTAKTHYPRDAEVVLEIPDASGDYPRGDVRQLLQPARREAILRGRKVMFVLNTPACTKHARIVPGRNGADTSDVETFLDAELALRTDTERALEREGVAAGAKVHGALEIGDAPLHVEALVSARLKRSTYRRDASEVSARTPAPYFDCTRRHCPEGHGTPRRHCGVYGRSQQPTQCARSPPTIRDGI